MREVIRARSKFPKWIQEFKCLKGICIGECIDLRRTISHGHVAHAHTFGKYRGWICLSYKYQLKEKLTLLHEVAHLITPPSTKIPPHGKKWKQTLIRIGGTYKSYTYKHNNTIIEYLDFTYRNNKW